MFFILIALNHWLTTLNWVRIREKTFYVRISDVRCQVVRNLSGSVKSQQSVAAQGQLEPSFAYWSCLQYYRNFWQLSKISFGAALRLGKPLLTHQRDHEKKKLRRKGETRNEENNQCKMLLHLWTCVKPVFIGNFFAYLCKKTEKEGKLEMKRITTTIYCCIYGPV